MPNLTSVSEEVLGLQDSEMVGISKLLQESRKENEALKLENAALKLDNGSQAGERSAQIGTGSAQVEDRKVERTAL